jgi:hypothetical protein
MTARLRRSWTWSVLLLALLAPPAWGEGDAATPEEQLPTVADVAAEPWTLMVIRLEHAKAEKLAETLNQILPPAMTVVPYSPTNSLIISAPSSRPVQPMAPE